MRTKQDTKCVICGEKVKQAKSTSSERLTCNRKKVKGIWSKSECEMEKNRRYQKKYRGNNPSGSISKKPIQGKSVALGSVKHLAKYKVKKYKRRCLKCAKKFTGKGAYNRICNNCTIENSRIKPLRGV